MDRRDRNRRKFTIGNLNVDLKGEKDVRNKLNKKRYTVINNVLLKTNKGSTQIDHIIISKYGIFVIETKNYKGIIKGSENDDMWKQILLTKIEHFRNLIKQNNGHIKLLKGAIPMLKNRSIKSISAFSKRAKVNVYSESIVTYYQKVNKIIKKIEKLNLQKKR